MPSHDFKSDLVCSIELINNCSFIPIHTHVMRMCIAENYSNIHNLHKICFRHLYSKTIMILYSYSYVIFCVTRVWLFNSDKLLTYI